MPHPVLAPALRVVLGLLTAPGLTAQASAPGTQGPAAPKAAERVGDRVPDFTFPEFWNGDGRQTLSAFRGCPVLIDFWGTH